MSYLIQAFAPAGRCKKVLTIVAAMFLAVGATDALTISSVVTQSGAKNDSSVPGIGTNGASGMNDPVPITGTITSTAPPNGTVIDPTGNPWTFSAAGNFEGQTVHRNGKRDRAYGGTQYTIP